MIGTKNWRIDILHIIRDSHKELNHGVVHYIYRKLNYAVFEHIKSNLKNRGRVTKCYGSNVY